MIEYDENLLGLALLLTNFTPARVADIRLPDPGGVLRLFNARGDRIDREDHSKAEVGAPCKASGKNRPLNFLTYRLGLKPD